MSGSIVIVTKNQYVLASKIHHINMDEHVEYKEVIVNGKDECVKDHYFQINVIYSPQDINTNGVNRSSEEVRECSTIVRNVKEAHKIFKSMIQQIRDQQPDVLHLNKALEMMLGEVKEDDMEEDYHPSASAMLLHKEQTARDRTAKKIRRNREAQGNSKAAHKRARRGLRKARRRAGIK